jgi:MFS family permease
MPGIPFTSTTGHSPNTPLERSRRTGFLPAALSFVAVFAAGATPIPLYDTYGRTDGLTNSAFSLAAVAYFVSAVLALIVLGRLSNHLGRRPVALAALILAVAGCTVLLTVDGLAPLLAGRALQGLAAGVASSALAAYAVDTAPTRPRWLVGTVTSAATTVGLTIGAFGSGALVQYGPAPRVLVYCLSAGVLIVCAAAILLSPETVSRTRGARSSLIPQLRVPAAARPFLPVAVVTFIATWALGGYYQSFSPSVVANDLGSDSALVAAAVLASYFAPVVLGGPLAARLAAATAQRFGMLSVLAAVAGLITAIAVSNAALFIVAGVIGGTGMGVAASGSMRALLAETQPAERAGLLSVVYAISYTGAALPSLIAGQLTHSVSLLDITIGYGVLVAISCITTLIAARNPTRNCPSRN